MQPKKSLDYGSRAVKLELDVSYLLWEGLDTPVSLACYLLAKHGEFNQLVEKKIEPSDYNQADAFFLDYQAVSLLGKSKLIPATFDKERIAREKYMQSEALCAETNDRLLRFAEGTLSPTSRQVRNAANMVPAIVTSIVGRLSKRKLAEIDGNMAFGPGSTVSIKRVVTTGRKYDAAIIDTSPSLVSYGLHCLPPMWKQRVTGFKPVTESKLTFVPKSSKTHRAIEVQPSLNIYVQKGIAHPLREALRWFGVDLDDQSRNQKLAERASREDDLWTIDLESASDTVAHGFVRYAFSYRHGKDWLALMEWARMDRVEDEGRTFSLEKFSAMGNGFTFELESLLFTAVVLACFSASGYPDDSSWSVYGDDIIVPKQIGELVVDTLKFFGFNANARKTYGNTYFRESCGADFFNGTLVTPIRFKAKPAVTKDDYIEICYNYGNSIIAAASRLTGGKQRDRRFLRSWLACYSEVPKHRRFRVSLDFASGGFVGSFDECVPSLRRASDGWQGYFFKYSYRPQAKTRRYVLGSYIGTLNGQGSPFSYGEETLRGDANRLPAATKTGYALAWPDLGPWV